MKVIDRMILFGFGGGAYYLMEVAYKGSSHWSMFLAGGICFRLIGTVRRRLPQCSVAKLCLAGSGIITGVEFSIGCIVNKIMHLNVWDYSALPLHVMGQICLPFSILWLFVSFGALQVDKLFCRLLGIAPKQDAKPTTPQLT